MEKVSFKVASCVELWRNTSYANNVSWNWGSNKYTWYTEEQLRDIVMYKITDTNNNIYLWSTQKDKPQVNEVYTASIKGEKDYKGQHQIIITRAKKQ